MLLKAIQEQAGVLFVERAAGEKDRVDVMPPALFIAALFIATVDSIDNNDLAKAFFSHLFGTSFTNEDFELLKNPTKNKIKRLKELVIPRIARLAIDQFIAFVDQARFVIGAAA